MTPLIVTWDRGELGARVDDVLEVYAEAMDVPRSAARGRRAVVAGHLDHPMRLVTREIAFGGPDAWTPELASQVADVFDSLAPGWHNVIDGEWAAIIADALDRGVPTSVGDRALEIGAGNCAWSPLVTGRFVRTVALDLSGEMLRRSVDPNAVRVQGDAARLPFATRSLDAVVLINAFLFPHETARVLREDGIVVWINALGERTPIHLGADEVADALGAAEGTPWEGVASRHLGGTWVVLHRPR